ncbi:MAG: hypothetical protein LAT68_14335 [Cyclobacteriaceae bacterium]|nr:hypothetical protein [Cyclobacteriaceae bacterium]
MILFFLSSNSNAQVIRQASENGQLYVFPDSVRIIDGLDLGDQVSDFQFKDIEGRKIDSKLWSDKLFIVSIWDGKAKDSKKQLPYIEEVMSSFELHSGVVFLSICDCKAKRLSKSVEGVAASDSIYFVSSNTKEIEKIFKTSVPNSFYLIKNKTVVESFVRPIDSSMYSQWMVNKINNIKGGN